MRDWIVIGSVLAILCACDGDSSNDTPDSTAATDNPTYELVDNLGDNGTDGSDSGQAGTDTGVIAGTPNCWTPETSTFLDCDAVCAAINQCVEDKECAVQCPITTSYLGEKAAAALQQCIVDSPCGYKDGGEVVFQCVAGLNLDGEFVDLEATDLCSQLAQNIGECGETLGIAVGKACHELLPLMTEESRSEVAECNNLNCQATKECIFAANCMITGMTDRYLEETGGTKESECWQPKTAPETMIDCDALCTKIGGCEWGNALECQEYCPLMAKYINADAVPQLDACFLEQPCEMLKGPGTFSVCAKQIENNEEKGYDVPAGNLAACDSVIDSIECLEGAAFQSSFMASCYAMATIVTAETMDNLAKCSIEPCINPLMQCVFESNCLIGAFLLPPSQPPDTP